MYEYTQFNIKMGQSLVVRATAHTTSRCRYTTAHTKRHISSQSLDPAQLPVLPWVTREDRIPSFLDNILVGNYQVLKAMLWQQVR